MTGLMQDQVGDFLPVARPTTSEESSRSTQASETLSRIAEVLNAQHVAAIRLIHSAPELEVVAIAGPGFLAPGMRLPLDTCDVAAAALSGHPAVLDVDRSEAALEALAYATGIETVLGLPVRTTSGDEIAGAVLVGSIGTHASPEAGAWAVAQEHDALLELLRPAAPVKRRLSVAHPDPLVAHGLGGLAAERIGAEARTCSSLSALIEQLREEPPAAVLCDEQLDGLPLPDVAYALRAAGAVTPLIAVSRTETHASVAAALRAGVAGYFSMSDDPDHIVSIIEAVLDGRTALPPAPAGNPAPALTERETEVLRGLDRGLTDYQIARELQVSLSTVKTHARRLFRKLEVGTRSAAVHRARREGLLQ